MQLHHLPRGLYRQLPSPIERSQPLYSAGHHLQSSHLGHRLMSPSESVSPDADESTNDRAISRQTLLFLTVLQCKRRLLTTTVSANRKARPQSPVSLPRTASKVEQSEDVSENPSIRSPPSPLDVLPLPPEPIIHLSKWLSNDLIRHQAFRYAKSHQHHYGHWENDGRLGFGEA